MNKDYSNVFLSSVFSGLLISIGCTVFLSIDNRVIGSVLFSIALFFVVSMRLWLFTGKIGFILQNNKKYFYNTFISLVGNFISVYIFAFLLRFTRHSQMLISNAQVLTNTKINDSFLSIFILAFFCGVLMFLGVNGYNCFESSIAKHSAVLIIVVVFILAGFEHCIANMFFFSISGVWTNTRAWCIMLFMIIGNSCGSIFAAELYKLGKKV